MTRVFISGYYGFANTGDEAILAAMLEDLAGEFGAIRATVVSGAPEETRQAHGVEAVLWSEPQAIAEAVRAADLVLVGGGGLFHDYTGFIPDALLTEGNWGLGFHITAALLAAVYEKPLMLYAVGVGPLFSEHGRRFARAACAAARAVTVRDPASRELLLELGVEPGKVRVTADPAFGLRPASPTRGRQLLAEAGLAADTQPLVAAALRHWSFGVHPAFWEGEVAVGLDAFLERHGGQVVFIPFQDFPGEAENDVAVATRVHSRMKQGGRAAVLPRRYPPADTAAILGAAAVVLGMRLHALLFSLPANRPFVALEYDPKVSYAVQLAGREDFSIPIGSLEAALLAAKLEAALATPPPPAESLAAAARANARIARETLAAGPLPLPPEMAALWRTATFAQLQEAARCRRGLRWSEEQLAAAQARLEELEPKLEAATEESARLASRLAELEPLESENARYAEELSALRETAAGLQESLTALEHFQAAVAAGIERFDREYAVRLALYRGTRGWKGMLVLRRAYTLLVRRGWRGRLAFFPWLLTLLAGAPAGIAHEELDFPTVGAYLPSNFPKKR